MILDSFTYFYPERPRLAQLDTDLVRDLERSPEWIAEPKYNGSRLMLHHIGGEFQFWSRHNSRLVYTPSPELLKSLRMLDLKGYWLFDGELRHNKTRGVKNQVVLYDVFISEGMLLLGSPFRERRGMLDILFHYREIYEENLDLSPQYYDDFRGTFDRLTQDEEIEGLVLKNLNGKLRPGRVDALDSAWMFKVRKPSGRYNY